MKKYAKIINESTKQVQVGVGCPDEYYIEIGMTLMDVEQAYNGLWYIEGYAPIEPEPLPPTKEEQEQNRAYAYQQEVDTITSHIQRLRDMEQTEEIIAEIEQLMIERVAKVEEIKARYPYPVDNSENLNYNNAELTL
jgi:hypothetical protein